MNPKRDTVLRVENLRVSFNTVHGLTHAVRGVGFELERGKTLAIVGESGSGKSVTSFALLRIIQRPGKITDGQMWFYPKNGEPVDIAALPEKSDQLFKIRGAKISMIFQEPMTALSPVHTIGNQVMEAIFLHRKVTYDQAWKIAVEMLARVGIPKPDERMKQYPFEFSGGMRQRVVIAMALVCRPEILIADEPTTALDVTIQAQILELIEDLKREMGTSVIFITHDLGVVAQVSDDVVVMNQGLIMETGNVRQIFKDPIHPYTRRLLASMPSVDRSHGVVNDSQISAGHIANLPSGYSVRPPQGNYRANVEPRLHKLSDGRQILIWPKMEPAAL